jgi:hypothetical protein
MKRLIAAAFAIAVVTSPVAFALERPVVSPASGGVADRTASPVARTAAAGISDIDAELQRGGQLQLEAETRGAQRVRFTYRGRHYAGRLADIDHDDGSRDWARTVRAHQSDRSGGNSVTIRVRACGDGDCTTRSSREYIEPPDRDDD